MQGYPHIYKTSASTVPDSVVTVRSPGLEDLTTTAPPEFGGPEGNWSPETLLVASVANCYILTFCAISRASKLDYVSLQCDTDGILDRVDNVTRFTRFDIRARLRLPEGVDHHKAERILRMSEANCLITNSLSAEKHLETTIE